MSMQEFSLQSHIESILFFKGEPMHVKTLSEMLDVAIDDVQNAILLLQKELENRGLTLITNGDEVALSTAPHTAPLIEKITKDELVRDLGKAGLETLAIILYKGSASRKEIDSIRGVNSSFILRNLSIRGLVERAENEKGERGYYYKPTTELIAHLGISRLEDLPEYDSVKKDIEETTERLKQNDGDNDSI